MSRRKHPELEPGSHLDRFRLERLLGTGAFGQVWLAVDEGSHGFRKRVALKILAKTNNQRRIDALMREARICGAMNHPNVVDVYGVMQIEDASFIIMEYVEGETLSAMWKDLDFLGVRFPRSIIADIGIAVAEALYHAWTAEDDSGTALHIVHRDLKPANVMISDRGIVKVADFGIAKVAPDIETTRTGKLKGTPSYLAPELWQGSRDFRPAIDLWSLGVILWEMATSKRFFGRAGMAEIFELVQQRKPEAEAREVLGYFPELQPIVARLLQRDPDDRHQSALKVAEKLRGIRHGLGASGDLLQFSRLVRAGRLEPEDRQGSLIALPALPPESFDWEPLMKVAGSDGGPVTTSTPWDTGAHSLKIGPADDDHQGAPAERTASGEAPALQEEVQLPRSPDPEPEEDEGEVGLSTAGRAMAAPVSEMPAITPPPGLGLGALASDVVEVPRPGMEVDPAAETDPRPQPAPEQPEPLVRPEGARRVSVRKTPTAPVIQDPEPSAHDESSLGRRPHKATPFLFIGFALVAVILVLVVTLLLNNGG